MSWGFAEFHRLLSTVHPDAAEELRDRIRRGELDPFNERQILDAAIDAHASRTGVNLTFQLTFQF